jgi:hypothetical protein
MDIKTARIRALNDKLRQHLPGGIAVRTPGVAALGQAAIDRIVKTIAVFDHFCHANDPQLRLEGLDDAEVLLFDMAL